jgi:uncharacterized protein (DUF927 family)
MKNLQDDCSFDLPDGYELRDDGIFLQADPENDNSAPIWLCSPLKVTAVVHDAHNMRWGRLIVAKDAAGKTHEWMMSASDLTKIAKISDQLLDRGLKLSRDRVSQKTLSEMFLNWVPAETILITDKLGWAEPACQTFTLADGTTLGRKRAIYAPLNQRFSPKNVAQCGNLVGWKQNVTRLADGNPVLVTAISLAFAGPLLRLFGLNGFGMHFKGESSTGKTTALHVATSVWGNSSLIQSWRTTSNALEGIAASSNDGFLALDELGEVSAQNAAEASYMLANGQGKGRSNARGAALASTDWKIAYLSTGEISFGDKLAEAGLEPKSGQSVRLVDIRVDQRSHGIFDDLHEDDCAADFSGRLKTSGTEFCGVAGSAFVEKLANTDFDLRKKWQSMLIKFKGLIFREGGDPSDSVTERAAAQFALIALAGELATNFELTGWKSSTSLTAATDMFGLWLIGRLNPLSADEIGRRIHEFTIHSESRLQWIGGAVVMNNIGWQDQKRFMFSEEGWAEIHVGLKPRAVAKSARAHGILTGADGDNLKVKAPTGIPNRPRLYMVNRSVLERHNLK